MPGHAIPVCSAAEAAALDRAAIEAGTPGRALMGRAGAAAAAEIVRTFARELTHGALVLAGPGNNGGDGWVVARALHVAGYAVGVWEPVPARTPDAQSERALALAAGVPVAGGPEQAGHGVVIDALLGTGAALPVRDDLVPGVVAARRAGASGACIVALDVPTGLDASTGAYEDGRVVRADLTITFGTAKRGHLIARDLCGDVMVVDIGLPSSDGGALPVLVDALVARSLVPRTPSDAHKGTRGRIAIVGGGSGMAGAAVLAARGALRTGAGLVKAVVHPASLPVVQGAVPQALAAAWPMDAAEAEALVRWADVVAIGPGLGADQESRALVERLLRASDGPVVLDADGLNVFAGRVDGLRKLLGDRASILTPHPAEMMRLAGAPDVSTVLADRFEIGGRLAADTGAAVLLKGTPTVVSAPDGRRLVTATGTPALATGGSGDVLTGIVATLLAQGREPLHAAAAGAWAHGRAAELATAQAGSHRGIPLDAIADAVADALLEVWSEEPSRARYPVIAELPIPAKRAATGDDA